MKPDRAYKINKEHDEKEFIRDAAIYLTKKKKTPTDILDCKFGTVEEYENDYLLVSGKSHVNYTCSVGYDRKETYYEDVKKYNSTTKSYYYEKQQKTRTVTDWSPHSGETSGEGSESVPNCSYKDSINYRHGNCAKYVFTSSKKESKELLEEIPDIHPDAMAAAESQHLEHCFNTVRLPGDHQKDKNYSGEVEVTRKLIVRIPEYKTTYTYNDKSYDVKGFAAGDIQSTCYCPDESTKIEDQAKKAVKYFKWIGIGLIVLAFVLMIVLTVAGVSFGISFLLYWICLIGGVVCLVLYSKKKKQKLSQLQSDKKIAKKAALVTFLERNKMAPLTEAEITEIDNYYL